MTLKEQRAAILKSAQDIVDAAVGRDLTPAEVTAVEAKCADVKALDASAAKTAAVVDYFNAPINGNGVSGKVLALTGPSARAHAAQIAAKALGTTGGYGVKAALESGSVVTPVPLQPGIIEQGKVPATLLELLPVTVRSAPSYRYLRQTVRTNLAAIVAPGDTKPTSIFTVEEVNAALQVFAHMSQPVDKYLLSDSAELTRFLEAELFYGLHCAIEDEILNGDGSPGHLSGILDHAIQTQAFSVDMVTSLRAAVTKLEVLGYGASAFVLAPTDWQSVETTRNLTGTFDLGGPIDRAGRRVWGVPVVLSTSLTAGTALALDASAATISTDAQGIEVKWTDQSGTLFDTNQLRARVEGRFNIDVTIPAAIVEIALTDGGS